MNARRIHLTGASGSGTTTLGRALAARSGYAHLDADAYFWESTQPPFQVIRSKPERLARVVPDLAGVETSILSGSIVGWDAALEDSIDLIIFLSIPAEIRLARLRAREIERCGKVNEEFITWAARHENGGMDLRSRARHEPWLAHRRCPIIRLDGDLTTEQRLAAIFDSLPPGNS